jgi:hypothetical protein
MEIFVKKIPHKSLFSILGVLAVFLFIPSIVYASVQYSRTPTGQNPISPITVYVSFDNFEADTQLLFGDCPTWSVEISDNTTSYFPGNAVLNSINEGTFSIELPTADFTYIAFSCGFDGGGAFLEGDSSTPIFYNTGKSISGGRFYAQYVPEITILSPHKSSIFSDIVNIEYKIRDPNDENDSSEKDEYGLGPNPVSLYYSDKIGEWYSSPVSPSLKQSIVSGITPSGTYVWKSKGLVPGVLYRIIVDAVDMAGGMGQLVSDFFTVDFTLPTFRVSTEPTAVRSGQVTIYVDSSESLASLPMVEVIQSGAKSVALRMIAKDGRYEGVYDVKSGYDGLARILVTGIDTAGNTSTTTVSGGTFSVGMNPPSSPRITYPLPRAVIKDATVNIEGVTREDTEVVLRVNGVDTATAKPNDKGVFIFSGVTLEPVKNQGVNVLSVSARDAFGAVSVPTDVEVKYNSAPVVSISEPTERKIIGDQTTLVAKSEDKNNDPLLFTYEIATVKNDVISQSWRVIAESLPTNGFTWSATDVENGDYALRVIADDGSVTSTSSPVRVTIRNTRPFFRFEDGRQTISNGKGTVIRGRALLPTDFAGTYQIEKIDYSLDGGNKWIGVAFRDEGQAKVFSVTLPDFKEGEYQMLWRVSDSRRLIGRSTYRLVVDTTAPRAPTLSALNRGALISSALDEDSRKSGTQYTLSGNAEPLSTVTLSYGGNTLSTKTLQNARFSFPHVSFERRGVYDLAVSATDGAGNTSGTTTLSITYDNPPSVTVLNPKNARGLKDKAEISWNIVDADGDTIRTASVSYRRGVGSYRTLVADARNAKSYSWDASGLPEARDYELAIVASDGLATTTSITSFVIDRTIPLVPTLSVAGLYTGATPVVTLSGIARDALSGIEFVEYSIQKDAIERVWYVAPISRGFLSREAVYSLKYSGITSDGHYTVAVRAVDASGNISPEVSRSIRIDRTAPRMGTFFIDVHGVHLAPDEQGRLMVPIGSQLLFRASLEDDTAGAELYISGVKHALSRDISSGLWEATIESNTATSSPLSVSARDEVGNETGLVSIGTMETIEEGRVLSVVDMTVIEGAEIRVLLLDEGTGRFKPFAPASNAGALEVSSDNLGIYTLALSPGTYRLIVSAPGHKSLDSEVKVGAHRFVTDTFVMEENSTWFGWLYRIIDTIRY